MEKRRRICGERRDSGNFIRWARRNKLTRAWDELQIEKVRQKPSYPGNFVDEDRQETFKTLHRLHLARRAVTIVPTHDHQATLQMPA